MNNLYNYFYEPSTGKFEEWEQQLTKVRQSLPKTNYEEIYIPTEQSISLSYYLNQLIDSHKNLMLSGNVQCGKTSYLANFLKEKSAKTNFIYV